MTDSVSVLVSNPPSTDALPPRLERTCSLLTTQPYRVNRVRRVFEGFFSLARSVRGSAGPPRAIRDPAGPRALRHARRPGLRRRAPLAGRARTVAPRASSGSPVRRPGAMYVPLSRDDTRNLTGHLDRVTGTGASAVTGRDPRSRQRCTNMQVHFHVISALGTALTCLDLTTSGPPSSRDARAYPVPHVRRLIKISFVIMIGLCILRYRLSLEM